MNRLIIAVIVVSSVVRVLAGPEVQEPATRSSAGPVLLGVLEQGQTDDSARREFRHARVLFKNTGGGWEPFPEQPKTEDTLRASLKQFPAEVPWTVAFDGRNLGPLRSVNPAEIKWFEDWGVQDIDRSANVPRIGTKPNWVIDGWYRPLVLVSRPNYEDPDLWKPRSGVVASSNVIRAFRKQLAGDGDYDTEFTDGLPAHKVPMFADKDVVVVRAYVARTGEQLLAMALSRNVAPWAYGPGLRDWATRWFAVVDQATVVPLGDFLTLVDAGDYDRDGRSELLFYKAGYDLGEYIIWWDGFAHHASFGWSPH